MKKIIIIVFLLIVSNSVWADIAILPSDLNSILQKISKEENRAADSATKPSGVKIANNEIAFVDEGGVLNAATYFSENSPSINKHIGLKLGDEDYAFSVALENFDKSFSHSVVKINGHDALIFFNDENVFVYTQAPGEDGHIDLKEWIYARKPNTPTGSVWQWNFVADQLQWPITLGLDAQGQAKIYRNVPISGFPIATPTRYKYMMEMMLKPFDTVKKFFPFQEEIATVPNIKYRTQEGIEHQAEIGVLNTSAKNDLLDKQGHRMNFKAWDQHWQSELKISIKASPQEYPILVSP